tara:strand:- start:64 stop:432 length:369 start_codon:yes stop_codon:yes gene_type:complete
MYFIYFDDKDNVVILNDKVIYKSFEDTIEPQLFHRNGGVFSLSYKMIDKTYFFQLKRDPRNLAKKDTVNFPNGDEYSVFSLIFDMSDLTYMIRRLQMNSQDEIVSTSNGTSGTCIKGDFEYL